MNDADTTNTVTVNRALNVTGSSNRSDAAAPSHEQLLAMLRLSADNATWTSDPLALIDSTHTSGTLYWQFNSADEAFNYLATGETLVLTYTVTATDDDGTPIGDTETSAVTATCSSDGAVTSQGPDAESRSESNSGLQTTGNLTVTDVDTSDLVTATRTLAVSGTSNRSDPAAPSNATLLGMFSVSPTTILSGTQSSASLTWSFDSAGQAFNYLATGETLVLTYTVTVTDDDGTPLSDSETVTLTITGTNDAPVIAVLGQDADSADLTETNAALSTSGTLTVSDTDRTNTVAPSVVSVVAGGVTTGLQSGNAQLLAMLTVDSGNIISSTTTDGTLNWNFNSGSDWFNHLAQGEQLVLTYTVRATDSASGQDDQTVVLTITGTNDKPTVSMVTPADFAEASNALAQSLTATGSVDFADLDASDEIDVIFQMAQAPAWSGGLLPNALAQSLAAGFSVSASNVSVTTPVSWSYSHAATDFDFLGAGESITFSYDVIVTDKLGQQATATVNFTLNGSNDAPALAAVSEINLTDTSEPDNWAGITGSLISSDKDDNDSASYAITGGSADMSRNGYDLQRVGSYGTLYLSSSTGAYEYVPNDAAINALTANASESFTLTVTDGSNASASRVLSVNVQASNDAPELTASPSSTSFIDQPGDDLFVPVNGQLVGSDPDTGASLSFGLQGATANTSISGFDKSRAGVYGTLYLNSNTGAYRYVPLDAAIEGQAQGTKAQDDFVFVVSDGTSQTTTGFTAWMVGAGDPPVFSDGDDAVALTEGNIPLTTSGSLTLTDSDLSDSVNLSKAVAVSASSSSAATHPPEATLLNMFSLSTGNLLGDTFSNTASVNWAFNSGTEHFDYLAAGETLVLSYTITGTDTGNPAHEGHTTVTVTITGTNDGPALVAPTALGLNDTAGSDTLASISGTLNASDADHNALLTYSLANQVNDNSRIGFNVSETGRFGTLYLNSATGAYLFVPNGTEVEALKQDASERFTLRASDGTASASQTLTVSITAGNDTPVLGTVSPINFTDTSGNDSFTDITGTLTSGDRDGDAVSYAVAGQVSEALVIDSVSYDAKRVGIFGTLYLNSNSGAYRFVPHDAAIEAVKTSASEVFSLVASDGSASDSALLTVNISGSNDTPALSASVTSLTVTDTAANDQPEPTTGQLTASDRDAPETAIYGVSGGSSDTSRSGYDTKRIGNYGTLYLNSGTGAYEYVPQSTAVNALTANANESFTLQVSDGSNASVNQVLAISLVAANDKPEVNASVSSTTYVDTTATDTFSAVVGTLTGSDRDTGATWSFAIDGGAADTSLAPYTHSLAGIYGKLYLNATTGAYTYVPDTSAINGLSGDARDEFKLLVTDGTATQSTAFTAWLVGATDKPTFSEGNDRVDLQEANEPLTASGSLTVTDSDLSDQVAMTHSVTITGTSAATHPSQSTLLAMLTLTPGTALSGVSDITAPVSWNFNSGSEHFNYLAAGETLTLTYAVTATDSGTPALSDTTTVVIEITGTNDGPALVAPASISLEDTANDDTLVESNSSFSGSDTDHNAALVYSLAGQVPDTSRTGFDFSLTGRYGKLYLNSSTGAHVYAPDDAIIEGLKSNASESFSVRVSDGMTTATRTLSVAISAGNDTPTLNASVVSANFADTSVTDRFQSVSGALTSSDRDSNDAAFYSLASGQADSSRAGYNFSQAGIHGTLFLNTQTGAYLYVPDGVAINALTGTATENFSLRVTDGSSATVSQTLTFTFNGTNDVPQVTNAANALAGNVKEAGHNDDGTEVVGTATATGTLSVSDVDASATRTWSLQGTPSTTYGTMALDVSTGTWTYSLDNSLTSTQALEEGEVVTQTFTARATDDLGTYVEQTLAPCTPPEKAGKIAHRLDS